MVRGSARWGRIIPSAMGFVEQGQGQWRSAPKSDPAPPSRYDRDFSVFSKSSTPMSIVNLAAYKFISLDAIDAWRSVLRQQCDTLALRGTILLAPEGINLFVAGTRDAIDAFIDYLRTDPMFGGKFTDLQFKQSLSDKPPFRRMLVRLKREIITMKSPVIRPEAGRAPAVDAHTLKKWLDRGHDDAGRPVVMLDTRNAFEVDVGTFDNTIDYRLTKFSEFPDAVASHRDELAGKTVRVPTRWRHPEVFRGGRRRTLPGRLFRIRSSNGAESAARAHRHCAVLCVPRGRHAARTAIAALCRRQAVSGLCGRARADRDIRTGRGMMRARSSPQDSDGNVRELSKSERVVKFSTQIKPISYLKGHAAAIIKKVSESREPMLITQNGEAKLVVMDVRSYEQQEDTLALLKILAMGRARVRAVFLEGAEEDLKALRRYIIKRFGKAIWQETYQQIKDSFRAIWVFPERGGVPDELVDLGLQQYRQVISGMNRVLYEVRDKVIYIHIVCDTRRDMKTLLSRRLLRVIK
ncbi:hypothetical protein DFQ30_001686 [Apophysomyces sp. BC1015]|nr:hypothetical protein DFQ30_001686 [Apophysomyces sp. BC1015]